MATTEVTAEDVAIEFVATKMALEQCLWHVSGHTSTTDGFEDWVRQSPVAFAMHPEHEGELAEDVTRRLTARADEIEIQFLKLLGGWLLDRSSSIAEMREEMARDGIA